MPSAVRRTTSSMMSRASCEAVMSRNTSSSAPWASYATAASTGSPASRRSTNRTPFTTRPSLTSRQGMIRLASTASGLARRRAHADDRPRGAGLQHRLDGGEITQAAADLHGYGRDGGDDFRDQRRLARMAERAVEIDDVQALRTADRPLGRHRDGILGEDRLGVGAPFAQTHASSLLDVDRRNDDHAESLTIAAKFSSMRSPQR